MGTFNITSSSLNSNYTYQDESIIVNGAFVKDVKTDTVQSVSGTAYKTTADGSQGDYVGNFNGYMRDGEIKYSISEMTRKDSNKVWDAIDDIEFNITDGEDADK